MALRICSLASGSKGNAIYISDGRTSLLVDAGAPFSAVEKGLEDIGAPIQSIDGILITHEHNDHIRALPRFTSFAPVYAHEKTAAAIEKFLGTDIPLKSVANFEAGFTIGSIDVQPFRVAHDASYPLGFSFMSGNTKITVATDVGHITAGLLNSIRGSDILLIESNHDIGLLLSGSYPERLKRRIMGAQGHLSNDASAEVIKHVLNSKLKRIILGHLSMENNLPELAFSSAALAIEDLGAQINKDVCLDVALQFKSTPLFEAGL